MLIDLAIQGTCKRYRFSVAERKGQAQCFVVLATTAKVMWYQ
jgi:hypothetical protein